MNKGTTQFPRVAHSTAGVPIPYPQFMSRISQHEALCSLNGRDKNKFATMFLLSEEMIVFHRQVFALRNSRNEAHVLQRTIRIPTSNCYTVIAVHIPVVHTHGH